MEFRYPIPTFKHSRIILFLVFQAIQLLHVLLAGHDDGGAVAVGVDGVAAGVEFEDVVYHRQAEAPHHLAVEEQVAVVEAVAEPVEVLQQDFCLTVVDLDDGVLVEADAAPDAVVVRRQ